jgi:aerobic carbon-monoxide dehydrogenase medium subunit
MTLPPFDLHRPTSEDEATELLHRYGDDAAVICGGTELLLLLKLGYSAYGHLVAIDRITTLRGIQADNGNLVIGSASTHREIESSPLVLERLPALAAMERKVANIRVRNVGTLGGNLCFSDPHSDPATFLLALDAETEWEGHRAPLSEFLIGPYQTALSPGKLLRTIRIPLPPPSTGIAHHKLAFHERPAATVTTAVRVRGSAFREARIAVGAVGARAVRARAAEARLDGVATTDAEAIAEAAERAAEESDPMDDANGSAEYKQQLVRVLVTRCLDEAVAAALESPDRP